MKFALSLASVISLLTYQSASAHGIWTEQRYGHHEVVYGHGAEDDAYTPEKIKGVWAYDENGGMVPVTVTRLNDHVRLEPTAQPAVIAAAFDNGVWSKDREGKSTNAPMEQVPGAVSASHSYKYSLSILKPHAHLPDHLRLAMIIRPLKDPTEVGVGNALPVEVLIDGKPAAGVPLFDDYRGMPEVSSTVTDRKGRAQIIIRNAGLNVIVSQAKLPITDGNTSERSLSSSLSFVGEAHQH